MKIYNTIWRNKWLTADAKSIDDMIAMLNGAVEELKEMKEAGITLQDCDCTGDDYAFLETTDPEVAERFGLHEDEDWEDDDEELT